MADYRESNMAGTQYRRCHAVVQVNPSGGVGRAATFVEEDVLVLADREVKLPAGNLVAGLTADNAGEQFELPVALSCLPAGAKLTYQDYYLIGAALYLHVAQQRDVREAARAGGGDA